MILDDLISLIIIASSFFAFCWGWFIGQEYL